MKQTLKVSYNGQCLNLNFRRDEILKTIYLLKMWDENEDFSFSAAANELCKIDFLFAAVKTKQVRLQIRTVNSDVHWLGRIWTRVLQIEPKFKAYKIDFLTTNKAYLAFRHRCDFPDPGTSVSNLHSTFSFYVGLPSW